jgi:lysozyme family protein
MEYSMNQLNNFKRSLEFTLKWEGGYSNDPTDPGGETKWGISKRAHPDLDIKGLTPERAAEIYATDYWDKAGCDALPYPLCACVFDTAVNLGVGRAKALLGTASQADASGLKLDALQYCNRRIETYLGLVKKNPALQKYLRGWLNRVNDLKKLVSISLGPD